MSDDAAEIARVVASINRAWLEEPPAKMRKELERHFHPGIVMRGPQSTRLAVGRDACIASYADFAGSAMVVESAFSEPEVDLFGGFAIASTAWRLLYDMGGARYDETGHDVFAFAKSGGAWQAVWRMLLTDPA